MKCPVSLSYRELEEMMIMRVALSTGGTSSNAINSVSTNNPKIRTYIDAAFVIQQPVGFEIGINDYVIQDGLWEVICVLPVKSELINDSKAFHYSSSTNEYYIWEKSKD